MDTSTGEITEAEPLSIPCLRVTQLDTHDLDNYLVNLLIRQQLDKCLKHVLPRYSECVKPELQTALYGILLYCTVGKLHQSCGQKLFGVMLADSKLSPAPKSKIYYLIAAELFLHWWKSRYNDMPPSFIASSRGLSRALDIVIGLTKLCEIFNFLFFLQRGEFSRIILRMLGLRMVFDHPNPVQSAISYTLISREILWNGFAEATMYFLTLFNIPRLRSYALQQWRSLQPLTTVRDLTTCPLCREWPSQPHETNCGHVFCYYCAATAVSNKSKCPICNALIESLQGPKVVLKSD